MAQRGQLGFIRASDHLDEHEHYHTGWRLVARGFDAEKMMTVGRSKMEAHLQALEVKLRAVQCTASKDDFTDTPIE
jgi:hypothetical protein